MKIRIRRRLRRPRASLAPVSLLALVLFAAAVPANAPAANDRLLYNMVRGEIGGMTGSKNGPLTTADTVSGANQRLTGYTMPFQSRFALSPDGQLIARGYIEGEEPVISISRSDGSNNYALKKNVGLISFGPDGESLLVGGWPESSCPGVCLMSLDGSSFKTLTTYTGHATISPDGTKLAWTDLGKTSKTKYWQQLFVAKTDGTAPIQITNFTSKTTPPGVYGEAAFGPNNLIAFWGEPLATNEIWTIKADGTGLAKVPIGAGNLFFSWTPEGKLNVTRGTGCGMYTVNPDGSSLARVPVNEESTCKKFPGWETGAIPKGVYRQPSTTVGYSDYLASQFEPVLRFDSSEQWRPLNVDLFFAEGEHEICESESCDEEPIESAADLNRHRGESAYINIAGSFSEGAEGAYHSPYEECTSTGLRECDTGPRSAIYWRDGGTFAKPPEVGYPFIDYWFFYRANYFSDEVGFHEGDWEGVTIAPSLTAGTFDYAAFSQHGTFYSYLRDVLRCEDAPAESTPEPGTCGSESLHDGFRVDVFPANGTHANYTTPCSEQLPTSCRQNAEELGQNLPERGYDGEVRWGRAFDDPAIAASSLLEMPGTEEETWTDWPGKWGRPGPGLQEDGPGSPVSEANEISVECANLDNDEEACDPGPRAGASSFSPGGAVSPGTTAVSCASWIGQGITAAACDPRVLRRAVLTGSVGATSNLRIALAGTNPKGRSASGRGVAQLAGAGIRNGTELRLSGPLADSAVVWLRVNRGHRHKALVGKFKLSSRKATAGRKAHRKLRLRLRRSGSVRPRLWLGRFPAQRVFPRRVGR